ncbi:2Fe-2S iron-sulfur cluster-binding protein [Streptomyces sp. NPDC050636]|uniref:2Fe-2S iron-sulfur cluster-binding protein n=1 Tax=Streptomyces sp. NPDC050636 TaxID=3154510 RepID=UPI0034371720
MDPKVWWYVARASGLTAWWLVSLAALWGLLLSTRVLGGRSAPAWLLDLHRQLGGLSVSFTAVHLIALVLDPVLSFGWAELLVPFAREANPSAQACGVVAVYFLAAIQITSLLKSRLPDRLWRHIHRTAFGVFALATVHAFTAGSDADGPLVRYSAAVIGAAFVFLVVYRLAAGRHVLRAAARPAAPQAAAVDSVKPRGFHRLTVSEVRRETAEAVSVAFEVPDDLAATFHFRPGQHLTLKTAIDGVEVRRPYSICSGITDGELRVAVKSQPEGRMSNWVANGLRAGDRLEVGVPGGPFAIDLNPLRSRHVLGVAAGSGITPILSIVKSTLAIEPRSRCTLVYGNRDEASTIFREQLTRLEKEYTERLRVLHVLSRPAPGDTPVRRGRLDGPGFRDLTTEKSFGLDDVDEAYMCGPPGMTEYVRQVLTEGGLAPSHIHSERFTAAASPVPLSAYPADTADGGHGTGEQLGPYDVTVTDQGVTTTLSVPGSVSVLEAALRAGLDVPYSCQEGICGTCRAKVTCGDVHHDPSDLEPAEASAGFALACRTRPAGPGVTLDFDRG